MKSEKDRRVGITTTIPIEVLLAGRWVPVDLNNVFITHPERNRFAMEAERSGLPRTVCGWNKGVLAAALTLGLPRVVEVVQGDCSTSEAVGAILKSRGVRVVPFAYPFNPSPSAIANELANLARQFGATVDEAERTWSALRPVRDLLLEIDTLTWRDGLVSGFENHLWLVSGSDFNTDVVRFQAQAAEFLRKVRARLPFREEVRVGYIGVPAMIDNLYDKVEALGGRVVFNEMQRQFSMCQAAPSLAEQYSRYTYPYSVTGRLTDIRAELRRRDIRCLLHYAQTFCFHQVEDPIFRHELGVPVLTLEADRPGPLTPRDEIRLENFFNAVRSRRRRLAHSREAGSRLGFDLGSRWVKVGVLRQGKLVHRELLDPMAFYRAHVKATPTGRRIDLDAVRRTLYDQSGLRLPGEGVEVLATGYGRHLAGLVEAAVIPELQAHCDGAVFQTALRDFTLLDIGGQDTKVVRVRDGVIEDFAMNDRCAAGSGRYLENMARILGLPVAEIGDYEKDPAALDAVCATFGESEVIGRIVEGVPEERICAGINHTVFQRILPDLARFPAPVLLVAGGAAQNRAILNYIRAEKLFDEVRPVPDPHFNGVIGVLHHPLS